MPKRRRRNCRDRRGPSPPATVIGSAKGLPRPSDALEVSLEASLASRADSALACANAALRSQPSLPAFLQRLAVRPPLLRIAAVDVCRRPRDGDRARLPSRDELAPS